MYSWSRVFRELWKLPKRISQAMLNILIRGDNTERFWDLQVCAMIQEVGQHRDVSIESRIVKRIPTVCTGIVDSSPTLNENFDNIKISITGRIVEDRSSAT